ncbi:hypothetical protein [Nitrosomonas sp.]|uniref:hypothetical protein n=1 Tax=Nitrosomonas sp. TaxID=42353 RepID=UPI0026264DBA|nr:hypothetical protein [Nitrosomonas sp.]MCW5600911.1 hypothetical protein [Nitrosomonas sp.]
MNGEKLTAFNRQTVGRRFQGERIPFGAHPICTRLVMGLLGVAQNAPLTGGQSAKRLRMVRCRWRGISPSPAIDKTAIGFDGVVRLER